MSKKDPIALMNDVANLGSAIDEKVAKIHTEIASVAGQWKALTDICGQRDDHAEALLKTLSPSVRTLRSYLEKVEAAIKSFDEKPAELAQV